MFAEVLLDEAGLQAKVLLGVLLLVLRYPWKSQLSKKISATNGKELALPQDRDNLLAGVRAKASRELDALQEGIFSLSYSATRAEGSASLSACSRSGDLNVVKITRYEGGWHL